MIVYINKLLAIHVETALAAAYVNKLQNYKIIEQGTITIYERLNESALFNQVLSENRLAISIPNQSKKTYPIR